MDRIALSLEVEIYRCSKAPSNPYTKGIGWENSGVISPKVEVSRSLLEVCPKILGAIETWGNFPGIVPETNPRMRRDAASNPGTAEVSPARSSSLQLTSTLRKEQRRPPESERDGIDVCAQGRPSTACR